MRVLFLTLYPDFAPSSRFRIVQYVNLLKKEGVHTEVIPAVGESPYRRCSSNPGIGNALRYYWDEFSRRRAALSRSLDYDAIVLQKGILSFWYKDAEKWLDACRDHLIFDADDAVHLEPPNRLPRLLRFLEGQDQTARIMERSRLVLVANEELAQFSRSCGRPVWVIPTAVDTEYFTYVPTSSKINSSTNILWMGNRSANAYVNRMIPILRTLQSRGVRVRLTVLSDAADFFRWSDFPDGAVRYVPWSLESEKAELARANVGIMPMPDNAWTQAKSGYKTLLYMASGLSSVSTSVGSIRRAVVHGQNGFFANTDEEWIELLHRLATDQALRKRIGAAARHTIEEKYALKKWYPRFKEALMSV